MTHAADPLAPLAAEAIAHMNADHADAVLAYARGLAGLQWAEAATLIALDANGMELQVRGQGQRVTARVPFEPPLRGADELRPALVAMAQRARNGGVEPAYQRSPAPLRDAETAARLLNAIATRRSIGLKELSPEPVDPALVAQILDAANWAPSHGKTEPWRFVVFSGPARRIVGEAFGAAYRLLNPEQPPGSAGETAQRERVWLAPVWIALGMRPDPKMPEWEELIAFGSAVQNAHLMASALGLGCKWTSGACATHELVAEAVGFVPATRLFGFLSLGWPAGAWPEGRRRPAAEKIRWISA
jgi:nitroreductase